MIIVDSDNSFYYKDGGIETEGKNSEIASENNQYKSEDAEGEVIGNILHPSFCE